ncbi:MAG: hypothetical protein ACYDCN_06370 [Bacteroidia bacterium]
MEESTTFEEQTKPQGLRILCVLTFIYSGIVGFFALTIMLLAKPLLEYLNENFDILTSNMSEAQIKQLQMLLDMGSGKLIIGCGIYLLILGLSFFGALQMWQAKYKGFIMYLIANTFFLLSNILSFNILSVFDALFIVLYYVRSKGLKK